MTPCLILQTWIAVLGSFSSLGSLPMEQEPSNGVCMCTEPTPIRLRGTSVSPTVGSGRPSNSTSVRIEPDQVLPSQTTLEAQLFHQVVEGPS